MLAWIKWIVKEHRAIAAFIVFILGIAGISIYGNVNEINPWKAISVSEIEAPVSEIEAPVSEIKIIEKTIETRIESGITKLQVDAAIEAFMAAHIQEYH